MDNKKICPILSIASIMSNTNLSSCLTSECEFYVPSMSRCVVHNLTGWLRRIDETLNGISKSLSDLSQESPYDDE